MYRFEKVLRNVLQRELSFLEEPRIGKSSFLRYAREFDFGSKYKVYNYETYQFPLITVIKKELAIGEAIRDRMSVLEEQR